MPNVSRKASQPEPSLGSQLLAQHARQQGDYPVNFVEIFRRDCVTKRAKVTGARRAPEKKQGQVIKEFSDRVARRMIFFIKNCDADFLSLITLTYPSEFPSDGKRVKQNLWDFKADYRALFPGRCIWWLEFQERGAPHFHLLSEENLASHDGGLVTKTRKSKYGRGAVEFQTNEECSSWLAYRWYSIVGSRDEKHLAAGTAWEVIREQQAAWCYAASHAAKAKQKVAPEGYTNVGGYWGKIGNLVVERFGSCKMDSAQVFETFGPSVMSSKGKIKKYIYDASTKISADDF